MAIVYHRVAGIAQLGFFGYALLGQQRLRIGARAMRLVAPFLPPKVYRRVTGVLSRFRGILSGLGKRSNAKIFLENKRSVQR